MKMRFIFILFLFIFSQQAHSCDSNDTIIIYKKQWTDSKGSWEDRYWQYDACVPSGLIPCYVDIPSKLIKQNNLYEPHYIVINAMLTCQIYNL